MVVGATVRAGRRADHGGNPGRSIGEGVGFSTSALHVRSGDEVNDLRLTPGEGGAVIVADTTAVTPGPGCTAQADGSARCVLPYTAIAAQVDVAGGDDHVLVMAGSAEVSGGAGNDTPNGRRHRVTLPLPRTARRLPLRVTFRTSEDCRQRSGGDLAGAFVVGPPT